MTTQTVGGKTIQIEHIQGIASGYSKETKTHVSGGGGRTINGTGYTESVKNHHTEHVEFWVQGPDGNEKHFKTTGAFIPIRDGQEVLVCYSVINGKEKVIMTKNLTSGDYYRDNTKGPLIAGVLFTITLSIVMFIWIGCSTESSAYGSWYALSAFVGTLIVGGYVTAINNKSHQALRATENEYIQHLT